MIRVFIFAHYEKYVHGHLLWASSRDPSSLVENIIDEDVGWNCFPSFRTKKGIWKCRMIPSSNKQKRTLVNYMNTSTKSLNNWGNFPSFQTFYVQSFITDSSLTLSAFSRSFCTQRSLEFWLTALASVHLRPMGDWRPTSPWHKPSSIDVGT